MKATAVCTSGENIPLPGIVPIPIKLKVSTLERQAFFTPQLLKMMEALPGSAVTPTTGIV